MDYMDTKPLCMTVSMDEQWFLVGDEAGCVYIVDPSNFKLVHKIKSLGSPIQKIELDQDNNIVLLYNNQISLCNSKEDFAISNYKLSKSILGDIVFMKVMSNIVLLGVEPLNPINFVILNLRTGKQSETFKPANWPISSSFSFLRSEQDSVQSIGGSSSGQLFIFDIN